MIAACVPLRNAYCAVVVVDETADPVNVVAAHSFPVGRLVDRDVPSGRYDKVRVVDDEAALEAAAQVVPLLQAHSVERLTIVRPDRTYANTDAGVSAAQRVADVIVQSLPEGIEVKTLKRWNKGGWTLYEVASLPSWPAWATFRVVQMAGALALFAARGRVQKRAPEVLAELARHEQGANATEGSPSPADKRPALGTAAVRMDAAVPLPREPRPILPGARIAAIDPGSAWVGLVVAEGHELPLRCLEAVTLPLGERVPLREPKVRVLANGKTKVTTHRHSVRTEHVDALVAEAMLVLRSRGVTHLALEHVDTVYLNAEKASAHVAQATAIARAAWVDGALGEAARAAGIEVQRVTATAWRGAIVRRKGLEHVDADKRVEAVVRAGFANWPDDADEHACDAAGLCMWLVRPREERAARAARVVVEVVATPKGPRARRKTAERVARDEAGCVCTSPRHRVGCPLYAPKTYRSRATMAVGSPSAEVVSPPTDADGGPLT